MSPVVPDVNVTLTADVGGFAAAARRAALHMREIDLRLFGPEHILEWQGITGERRHGLVKHARDLRRQDRKRAARIVAEGHTRRRPCPVCGAGEAEEHRTGPVPGGRR